MAGIPGRKKSAPERIAQAVVRRGRRIPAAEKTAVKVATSLRESQLARTIVSRTFDMDLGGVGGTVFLAGGNLLAGQGLDNVPVVILSLVGTPGEDIPQRLEEIAREQLLTAGFRPVLLISEDHFAPVRAYGWPVELVLSREQWGDSPHLQDEGGWEAYVERRLQQMRRNYRAAALLDFGPEHPMTLTYLRSLGPAPRP
ncbi:hypothetical protein FNH13_01180 [Ornithinimicrobium ciconiae]|uniref:Uncharacterized protein n=1 Tax=Ornithinimicrobium ciconiae TaxID=2594265 RepID=A0A516G6I2_9MICO|nr:hypothetical protein [Ornithinimicrobium ciconiae]QDO87105.1 hypothetical protein FNH13_01180 [Ornithinimicrobium ciconiae]